ncbi:MAG: glutathione S-transferase N-terminal domain-containing protein [bacterium]|nr:glutathione S-transferase N-terminal domain-containing protein [bacterium]
MKLIRQVLGRLILAINWLCPPRRIKRNKDEQDQIDTDTKKLALYQFQLCPFCVRVRRMIKRLRLTIELRDIKKTPHFQDELVVGGGKRKVPCLRIEEGNKVTWLYESKAINNYLLECYGQH